MPDIIITEFMEETQVARLRKHYSVHQDHGLCDDPDALCPWLADAKALIVRNRTQVTADLLTHAPHLKVIGRLGVGLDNIDMAACARHAITVCPARGANSQSVAEYVISAAFQLTRTFDGATSEILAGQWPRLRYSTGDEVAGHVLGLVGYGEIGQCVATRAAALGMTILACDPVLPDTHRAWTLAEKTTFDDVIARADILSLHIPLTPETQGLIGEDVIARMKSGAVIIQTARGGVVDEIALANAIRHGHLGGVALDVYEQEPPSPDFCAAFAGLENVILTPHIAGLTRQANARVSAITADNVLDILDAKGKHPHE